ncbi:hypothetical protein LMG28140_00774 [Paraburkholderia metrosideri]|uniref:Uncharacterized protein n=1 Tax=Paraburkholderia metrosideri TaxID=580937 RepID=A0ABN7HFV7_9BURK|nr:hypothetical protein LMG28140_00774 [Paraburkholderia metrosideri]
MTAVSESQGEHLRYWTELTDEYMGTEDRSITGKEMDCGQKRLSQTAREKFAKTLPSTRGTEKSPRFHMLGRRVRPGIPLLRQRYTTKYEIPGTLPDNSGDFNHNM